MPSTPAATEFDYAKFGCEHENRKEGSKCDAIKTGEEATYLGASVSYMMVQCVLKRSEC